MKTRNMLILPPFSCNSFSVFLLLVIRPALAQVSATLSTTGRIFVVYPAQVSELWNGINIYITTQSLSPVKVRIYTPLKPTDHGGLDYNYDVQADRPLIQAVQTRPSSHNMDTHYDGIIVNATDDVSVFVHNPVSKASGVTAILSYDSLGTNYFFPTFKRTENAQTSILIGNPDGANEVRVTLPVGPEAPRLRWKFDTYEPGQSFKINLNKDEFIDIRQQDGTGSGDLTGTQIVANKRVAVFSASVFYPPASLNGTINTFQSEKDFVIENIPPVELWGKSFVLASTPAKSPVDRARVLAGQDNATIWFSNGSLATLQKEGDYFDLEIPPGYSALLLSDKPIQVIQYRYTFSENSAPFMFQVPAIESYGNNYTVPVLFNKTKVPGAENYLVLMTDSCFADRVLLQHNNEYPNGTLVSRISSWIQVGRSNFVTSQVKVGVGFVSIAMRGSTNPVDDKFAAVGGFVFGMSANQTYAANLGLKWRKESRSLQQRITSMQDTSGEDTPQSGTSSLITRNRQPMALPLATKYVGSSIFCHLDCWKNASCFIVAFAKNGSQRDGKCTLYGRRAACAGFIPSPGNTLYKLHKQ